jgi:DNA-binding CsgD family transcriptional regulator
VDRALCGASDGDYEEWDRDWRAVDRAFQAMLARATPVHVDQVYAPGELERLPIYAEYGRRIRARHFMAAPIYGSRGTLVGAMLCCRHLEDPPFDTRSIAVVSILSGFLSATIARVKETPFNEEIPLAGTLTRREAEIAVIASSGRSNIEIALELGIAPETVKQTLRRVYRKLGVRGRVEMTRRLVASGVVAA